MRDINIRKIIRWFDQSEARKYLSVHIAMIMSVVGTCYSNQMGIENFMVQKYKNLLADVLSFPFPHTPPKKKRGPWKCFFS